MAKTFSGEGPSGQMLQSPSGVQTFAGAAPAKRVMATQRLKLAPTANFLLVYYPVRWQCHPETGTWFPCLGRLRVEAGLGGVDKNLDDSLALAKIARKGGVIIPAEAHPSGSYIQAIECEGGLYHCTIWERPQMLAGQVVDSLIDQDGYHEWLASLVENGFIKPPAEIVLKMVTDRQRKKLEGLDRDAHLRGVPEKIAIEKAQIDQMDQHKVIGVDDAPSGPSVAEIQAEQIAQLMAELAAMKAERAEAPSKPAKGPKAAAESAP
jgi:uncharacterized small protein (DUF1192 family)